MSAFSSPIVRPATERDTVALARLAELDSAPPLIGDVLLAEEKGVIVAATSGPPAPRSVLALAPWGQSRRRPRSASGSTGCSAPSASSPPDLGVLEHAYRGAAAMAAPAIAEPLQDRLARYPRMRFMGSKHRLAPRLTRTAGRLDRH